MIFFHLSDLHLGKSVHEFSMLEDQEYILKAILEIADKEKTRAVLIQAMYLTAPLRLQMHCGYLTTF